MCRHVNRRTHVTQVKGPAAGLVVLLLLRTLSAGRLVAVWPHEDRVSLEAARHAVPFFSPAPLNHLQRSGTHAMSDAHE